MAYTGLYNSNGQILTTIVNGSTYTGLYSPDGNWNIVTNDGSVYKGRYHPCGALNAVIVSNPQSPAMHANGSINVVANASGGYSPTPLTGTPSPASPEALAFLARTTGLDSTHRNAYIALIDGLILDGVWPKLDWLHVYATQDSTTALLNLVSTSYNGVINGAPTFTVDRGFVNGADANYISMGFNPTTAPSPKFVQNSAHLSAWSTLEVGATGTGVIGYSVSGPEAAILPWYNATNQAYFRTNSSGVAGQPVANSLGFYQGNRSSSTAVQGYKNGALFMDHPSGDNSVAVQNTNMVTLGININGIVQGTIHRVGSASCGSSMNATEAGNYYTRLRTYMTAVGLP